MNWPVSLCSYSVFRVISIDIPAKITGDNPIVIHLEAAIDNANEADDLPLAPWHWFAAWVIARAHYANKRNATTGRCGGSRISWQELPFNFPFFLGVLSDAFQRIKEVNRIDACVPKTKTARDWTMMIIDPVKVKEEEEKLLVWWGGCEREWDGFRGFNQISVVNLCSIGDKKHSLYSLLISSTIFRTVDFWKHFSSFQARVGGGLGGGGAEKAIWNARSSEHCGCERYFLLLTRHAIEIAGAAWYAPSFLPCQPSTSLGRRLSTRVPAQSQLRTPPPTFPQQPKHWTAYLVATTWGLITVMLDPNPT
jgi:hypothetical protein